MSEALPVKGERVVVYSNDAILCDGRVESYDPETGHLYFVNKWAENALVTWVVSDIARPEMAPHWTATFVEVVP